MKVSFLGAAHEVTGSCTLLEACGKKILVDCGMEQGADIYQNCDMPISPTEIDFMFLTHAHIDHSGKIPVMVANGFSGKIYTTVATQKLCNIMLMDSAHIQEFEAAWKNRKIKRLGGEPIEPMYTTQDVQNTLPLFEGCDYNKEYNISDSIRVKFIDAGHLLGSASIEIAFVEGGKTTKILFSGDIGNYDRPLIRNPQQPIGSDADYVVIESTYGNRLHGERPDYVSQLTEIIQSTLDRGGNVVIPCFAVGRTQEMLYLIREIKERGLIKNHADFPVFVDSPLAVEATNIYSDDMRDYYDEETLKLLDSGINPIKFKGMNVSVTSEDSQMINDNPTPKIILSASGMCEAGRIRHHLKHNLWRKDSTILFVGYQAEGTLGRKVIEGAPSVKLFGEEIAVNARIAQMEGISGHSDKNMLLSWLSSLDKAPKMIFVNHGNDLVCDEFAAEIKNQLGFEATAPYNGAEYDLDTLTCLNKGNMKRIEKKSFATKRSSSIFERLLLAGKYLSSVIEKNRYGANKDIAKFADQVNELAKKWDR